MISRQRRWQLRVKEQGLCTRCAFNSIYKGDLCFDCYNKWAISQRISKRKRLGHNKWSFGERGRPPIIEMRVINGERI